MVESICGQGFVYAREVEEEIGKITSQTRVKKSYRRQHMAAGRSIKIAHASFPSCPFITAGVSGCMECTP
jgi:hypothetical protein